VSAQEGVHERALAELRAGRKRSHWMWFVFPQAEGLGSSAMAARYAIRRLDEARAYLRHPVLGPRLVECTRAVNAVEGRSAHALFGWPDDMKFRSSMTLFELVAEGRPEFAAALDKYYNGERDHETLKLMGTAS
jgi:uncharacterized protein (DUF1810 family)